MERTLNFPACNPLEKILLLLLFLLFFFHCWQFTSVHASKRCPCCTPPPPQPSRYMVHATHTFLGGKLGHYFTRRGFTHTRAHTHGLVLFASTFSIRYSCSRAQPMCSRVWSHMTLALYRPNMGEGPCRGKRMTPLPFQPIVDNVRIGTWQNLPWISAPYVRCFINTGCVLLIQTALWIRAVLYEYGLFYEYGLCFMITATGLSSEMQCMWCPWAPVHESSSVIWCSSVIRRAFKTATIR